MPSRRLALRRHVVSELSTDELRSVHGGDPTLRCSARCAVTDISCLRCPSVPITNCTVLQETDTLTCPTDVC